MGNYQPSIPKYHCYVTVRLTALFEELQIRKYTAQRMVEAVPDYLPHMPAILYHNNMKM